MMLLKKIIVLWGLLVAIILPISHLEAAPRVAVIPFNDQSARKVSEADKDNAWDFVEITVVQKANFDQCTRSREEIKSIVTEMNLNNTAAFDSDTSSKLGRLLGVQYLILGNITGVSTESGGDIVAHLSLRMIEVETARIYLAGRGNGKSRKNSQDALEKAAEDALNGKMGMLTMMKNKGKK